MKTAYYCFGGGLGHLTRFLAWCHTTGTNPLLLTNCAAATTPGLLPTQIRVLMPSPSEQRTRDSLGRWLRATFEAERPDQLVVDAFPGGILGELSGQPWLTRCECIHLARILKLSSYLPRLAGNPLPRFTRIFKLEQLHPDHEMFLAGLGENIDNIKLADPPDDPENAAGLVAGLPKTFELVVHSGSHEELQQLYDLMRETWQIEAIKPDGLVVSPGDRPTFISDEIRHLNCYPAGPLLKMASRVYSGAGFNIMRQMASSKVPHLTIPFVRALDDQFFRAALRNNHFREELK